MLFPKYLPKFLLLGSILSLGACAYVVDGPSQDLTITTPGAQNSLCYAYINGLKYKFRPAQTVRVTKGHSDLTVDCLAPGNRRKKVVIKPKIESSTLGNVVTGVVPGVLVDGLSEAIFTYPEVVEVNFTDTPVRPEALPAHNSPDIKQPEEYDLEEFTSDLPRLNSDRNAVVPTLQKRERRSNVRQGRSIVESITTSDVSDSKSPPVTSTFGGSINPAGNPTPASDAAPVPLYPGE